MEVKIDWGLCEGNGVCAVEAPDIFEMGDDDELIVLREQIEDSEEAAARAAARACPKHAIDLVGGLLPEQGA